MKGNGSEDFGTPSPRHGVLNHLLGLFEIVPVAVLGAVVAQLLFSLLGYSGGDILQEARLVVALLSVDATVTVGIVLVLLAYRDESPRRIGWRWRPFVRRFLLGVAFVPALFAATIGVSLFFRAYFPDLVTEVNPLLELIRTRLDLWLFILTSIYVGGFKEELQRSFALERFEEHLGGLLAGLSGLFGRSLDDEGRRTFRRISLAFGLLFWSVLFGLGHLIQGVDNAVGAAVLGLIFGLLYIWKRNLVIPIVAHALYDIVTLIIFWNFVR